MLVVERMCGVVGDSSPWLWSKEQPPHNMWRLPMVQLLTMSRVGATGERHYQLRSRARGMWTASWAGEESAVASSLSRPERVRQAQFTMERSPRTAAARGRHRVGVGDVVVVAVSKPTPA